MTNITEFQIVNLFGYKNFNLKFDDNTLILVGENGSGKTTVLRLFYYFVTGQWNLLSTFHFEKLAITIDDKKYFLPHAYLEKKIDRQYMPPSIRKEYEELLKEESWSVDMSKIEMFSNKYGMPIHYLIKQIEDDWPLSESKKSMKLLKEIRNALNMKFLYLPTYRRIEQELKFILKGRFDIEDTRSKHRIIAQRKGGESFHVELIEFGMQDVENDIKKMLESLKEFQRQNLHDLTLRYFGDVVEQKYLKVDVNKIKKADNNTIENVLSRIEDHLLSFENKKHVKETIKKVKQAKKSSDISEHENIICHYFIKLLEFQRELQEKELQMTRFCQVCNTYLVDKKFFYDSVNFKFSIRTETQKNMEQIDSQKDIELSHLSSGEKQIVSLFSHLYLSGTNNKYFVLIDEPELSLSVEWQQKFLIDIKKGEFCLGLIAVTHSPFIFDNELKKYARGLGEFLS